VSKAVGSSLTYRFKSLSKGVGSWKPDLNRSQNVLDMASQPVDIIEREGLSQINQ